MSYVAQFVGSTPVRAYKSDGQGPICNVKAKNVNGIAVDPEGDLWVPDGDGQIWEFTPGCGKAILHFTDTSGQPAGIALHGHRDVYIANVLTNAAKGPGNVQVYDWEGHLLRTLTDSVLEKYVVGVAVDTNNDVFATYWNGGGSYGRVIEFKNAKMPGMVLPGVQEVQIGAPLFDSSGNLLIPEMDNNTLVIVRPPFTHRPKRSINLLGSSAACALNSEGTQLSCADWSSGSVDVYGYPSGASLFSYSNGLSNSLLPMGIAEAPALKGKSL